jgi:hypothetical protein
MPKIKSGFLRKAARMDKKKQADKKVEDAFSIEEDVRQIMLDAGKAFDSYSVIVVAYAVKKTLEEVLEQPDPVAYAKHKLFKANNYVADVAKAMGKEF